MARSNVLALPIGDPPSVEDPPKSRFEHAREALKEVWASERTSLIHWVPVCLGCGMALYFALPFEPPVAISIFICIAACLAFLVKRLRGLPLLAIALILGGFSAAQWHSRAKGQPLVASQQPVRTYVATVSEIERRTEGGWRLVLDEPQTPGAPETSLPNAVRITVRTEIPPSLTEGERILVKAVLTPLPGPVLPGGYDFGRALYFDGIGATGFAVSDVTLLGDDPAQPPSMADKARNAVRLALERNLSGDSLGVALALLTGDRSGISRDTREAYRQAGLAHLLAISGLHMALIAGAVFLTVRRGLTLWPRLALLLPLKAIAAGLTIAALLGYLALVGAPVSAQRATIMASAAMIAIMAGRDAISMRTAALAAILLLILRPSSVLDIGFQMSFAAVIALIAGYEAAAPKLAVWRQSSRPLLRGPITYMAGVFTSTILAEAAITPLTIYHFNEITVYGLAGNALAVPLTGFVIMPAGLLGLALMPLGLEDPAFWVMGQAIGMMTSITTDIAAQPYALLPVRKFSAATHLLLLGGFLWLCLWRTKLRYLGVAALLPAIVLADPGPKPTLIVNESGKTIALNTANDQLALVVGRRSGFAADVWARTMGQYDLGSEPAALRRCDASGCAVKLSYDESSRQFSAQARGQSAYDGKDTLIIDIMRHPSGWRDACQSSVLIIAQFETARDCANGTRVLHQSWLEEFGPVAIHIQKTPTELGHQMILKPSSDAQRPWHPRWQQGLQH